MSYQVETNSTIGGMVRKSENDWKSGQTTSSSFVTFNTLDRLNRIDAYLNSKHTSGEVDSLGREKPFANIVVAASNICYRATDIDRSQIKIKATKSSDMLKALLATVKLQDWMRREDFGTFLNEWGRVLSRYGSAVTKFVRKGNELVPSVIPWQRIICDQIDFDNNIRIEILDFTEAQLREQKGYDSDMVDKLCSAQTVRKTSAGDTVDQRDNYIRVYEVHGNLPLSLLTSKKKDMYTYVEQMHVISFLASKEKGEYDDYTLIAGREENPYLLTHLIREDGQTLSIGTVEKLFDAQWMLNHTTKLTKDKLDVSKTMYQTSDGSFVGQNVISNIEEGMVLNHKPNEPLTQVNTSSPDTVALQSFGTFWKSLSNEVVGISESMLGNTAPSGTAWRQVESLLAQNTSLFDLMKQNKALSIETMLRRFVIPFIKTQLDTSQEISGVLDQYNITKIDSMYVPREARKRLMKKNVDSLLQGKMPEQDQQIAFQNETQGVQTELSQLGNTRYFVPGDFSDATWKKYFAKYEWEAEVDILGESIDKEAITTLNTVLMTVAKVPNILQDPFMKMVFSKILMNTGVISPLELSSLPPPPQQVPSPVPAKGG